MADSDTKTQEQKAPESTALAVVKKEGGKLDQPRKNNGQFSHKPKPLLPTIEFTRKERKILNSPSKTKEGLTEHELAFRNILAIAQNTSEDPKAMMAAVKAYEILMRRALGKEAPSEQEMDKLTQQPVRTIMVVAPPLMFPDVVEEKPKTKDKGKPSFAEIVSVETNPKK